MVNTPFDRQSLITAIQRDDPSLGPTDHATIREINRLAFRGDDEAGHRVVVVLGHPDYYPPPFGLSEVRP